MAIETGWIDMKPNTGRIHAFGEVNTRYIPLRPLRKLVPKPRDAYQDMVPSVLTGTVVAHTKYCFFS